MFVYWEAAMSVGVTWAVLLNVSLFWKGRKELIIRNKIRKASSSDMFSNILEDMYNDIITQYVLLTKTFDSSSLEKSDKTEVEKNETIYLVDDLFKVKVISYEFHLNKEAAANKDQQMHQSINDILMKTTRQLEPLKDNDQKVALHNDVIKDMQNTDLLCGHISVDDGPKVMKGLTNALWHMDGQSETINDALKKCKHVPPVPERLK